MQRPPRLASWRATSAASRSDAPARFGKPKILDTDRGSQFTGGAFTGVPIAAGVRISMDGRGRFLDKLFIERLWRSLTHEDVYLRGYADGREARAGIASWISFCIGRRPHQAHGGRSPGCGGAPERRAMSPAALWT